MTLYSFGVNNEDVNSLETTFREWPIHMQSGRLFIKTNSESSDHVLRLIMAWLIIESSGGAVTSQQKFSSF